MKYAIYIIYFAFIFMAPSCKKNISCTNQVKEMTNSAQEYNSNPNLENCKSYKQLLQDWIESTECHDVDSATQAHYISELGKLSC